MFQTSDSDTKIAGLYDLQQTIGRGHYAVVKLARHVFTGEKVAVKVIDKTKLDDVAQDHLFQEVVCMKLVQHPNVVRLYEVIDTPNKLYLILELGDGGDLYDYIMKHGCGLHETVAKRYFRQIVTAIAYCHKLHVVHRDLKPENVVFFEKLGIVKLTDFGFSNRFTPGRNLETACGSLAYSAPEILLGDSYDAPKVDIWSLGVILYMLVCGRLPFQELNDSETLTKIMDCDYTIPDYLSPECVSLIRRLLIRDPNTRAGLDDVLQADWLQLDDSDHFPIEVFSVPLVSRECLSFEDHMEILSRMSEGHLASVEEIQSTLDRNEYNHIAATYFLLAERKLKRNYIEQYRLLSQQAQMNETLRQQQLQSRPQQCLGGPGRQWTTQYNEMSGKAVNCASVVSTPARPASATSTTVTTTTTQPVEERVRRFSMILEDEEEEEEEQKPTARSTFRRYLTEEHRSIASSHIVSPENNGYQHPLSESSSEAMLEEEEEELLTVANLASVRSDFVEQSGLITTSISAGFTDHTHCPTLLTRPCSRTSGSGVEASDGGESDASLSNWSAAGSFASPAFILSSAARSLPLVEIRRKPHFRRSGFPHRPLITVRSSPQLLKHITEEENSAEFATTKLGVEFEAIASSLVSKNTLSSDSSGARSLRTSFNVRTNVTPLDDNAVGLRSRLSWSGQRPLSTTHSPTRTRRFFTSTSFSARPTSIESWNTAFNMSLLHEFRRRSVCSSPVDQTAATTLRRKTQVSLHQAQSQNTGNRHQLKDRRCSGPPNLVTTMSNFYPLNTSAPAPSHSESNTSVRDPAELPEQLNELNEFTGDQVKFFCGSECPGSSSSTVNTENFTHSRALEKSPSNGYVPSKTPHKGAPRPDNNSPAHSSSTSQWRGTARSPHRSFSPIQRMTTWSSSSPLLYATDTKVGVDMYSVGPKPTFASLNSATTAGPALPAPPVVSSLREYCAPIREEDEAQRPADYHSTSIEQHSISTQAESQSPVVCLGFSTASTALNTKRTSELEPPSTSDPHSTFPMGSASSSTSDRSGPVSRVTTSAFSLSSLATTLRDSRHMLDVIRGTFELQCHYNKHSGGSVADGSSGGYPSGRASASASVRSLTAICEALPINTGLTGDVPTFSSRRLPFIRTGLSHDSSKTGSVVRALAPRRHSGLFPTGPSSSGFQISRPGNYNIDPFSNPSEMLNEFEVNRFNYRSASVERQPNLLRDQVNFDKVDVTPPQNGPTFAPAHSASAQHPSKVLNAAANRRPIDDLRMSTSSDLCWEPDSSSIQPSDPSVCGGSARLVGFGPDGDLNLITSCSFRSWGADGICRRPININFVNEHVVNDNNKNNNSSISTIVRGCEATFLSTTENQDLIPRQFPSSLAVKGSARLKCCTLS
ncbi:unnamed protein product [Dicrocoelium dendriticum]|nr:unnamed protein product [Dicrocoelium dendriticum]